MKTQRMILAGLLAIVVTLANVGNAPLAAEGETDPQPAQVDHTDALTLTWKRSTMWTGDFGGPFDSSGRHWQHTQFDDSTWTTTSIPNNGTDNGQNDYYYRAHFTWDGTSPVVVRFASDDGLQVYINGTQLGQWGSGWRIPGCVNIPSCLFNSVVPDQAVPTYMLQTGDNVIAVDLWNSTSGTYSLDVAVIVGDSTPPGAVTNLAPGHLAAPGQVELFWTAPDNNGLTGGAVQQYDIRYSTSPINEGNWGAATTITSIPTPAAPGTTQSVLIPNLTIGTRRYFGLKSQDAAGNWSALSNLPSFLDSGFRPAMHGYNFSNASADWGKFPSAPANNDLTIEDMRSMFGDGCVCVDLPIGLPCVPKPTAWLWREYVNYGMNGGHCLGMASTSIRFFEDIPPLPSGLQDGAQSIRNLEITTSKVRKHIAYFHVSQWTLPFIFDLRIRSWASTPNNVVDTLITAMANGPSDTLVLVMEDGNNGGHAVTPYALQDRGTGIWRIWIYDNNHVDDLFKAVEINRNTNTWTWGGWSGAASDHTLYLVPQSAFDQFKYIPSCSLPVQAQADSSSSQFEQLWFNSQQQLLITDSQGRRLGWQGSQFLVEIPGAFASPTIGGLGTTTEPVYTLPLTETYTLSITGQAQMQKVQLTQFGPGYAVTADQIMTGPQSQDTVTISPDGKQLAYHSAAGIQDIAVKMALDGAAVSYDLRTKGVDIGAGQVVTLAANSTSGRLTYNQSQASGGMYELSIKRADAAGEDWFIHSGLVISATDTHYINYGAWDGSGPITIEIDHNSDGTIDEPPIALENQVRQVYLPLMARN